ncbi:UPF0711 protein C18orf21 homolog isoform X1 [Varanus komodoensis]|uniref:Chromosome 18 open reading frame 21 n=1 Tax=Varanus komodoensis TaxID=61221 RepID=A0A8D2J609_VARKO|nr:UPF0711 protein C18orf21 homolog isoform X1 [Varanus komodoensis]XP_044308474.1 UPF0711 protein C18orf21 homolog isoform X1 [Varanus komodoensis]XP_044308483.1 UPF0711 protein C18orf21 homolog isoform X1 [Varanus komodoensis]
MRRWQYLEEAAWKLASTCPAQARFLLWTLSNTEGKNQDNVGQWCCYCFQFLHPGNYRVRLIPKMKMTPQIEKLINRKKKNYKLNLKQIKLLMKYKESKNVLLITCHFCRKTARHNGKSRKDLGINTPTLKTISNKDTPVCNSHSGSKTRKSSGSRISTSELSTPHSSCRTPRNAKSHFTQLKRLLLLEENKKCDKGDLKKFLQLL